MMIVTLLSIFTALPIADHAAVVRNPGPVSGGGVIGGGDGTTGVSQWWSVVDTGSADLYSHAFDAPSPVPSRFDLQTSGRVGALDGANIPVPDTMPQLSPMPGTMLLLGIWFLGIAVWERRRKRMLD